MHLIYQKRSPCRKKIKIKRRRRKLRWLNSRKSILLKARMHPSDSLGLTNEKSRKDCKPRQMIGKNAIRKTERVGETYRKHQKISVKSCFKHMKSRKLAGVCRTSKQ